MKYNFRILIKFYKEKILICTKKMNHESFKLLGLGISFLLISVSDFI